MRIHKTDSPITEEQSRRLDFTGCHNVSVLIPHIDFKPAQAERLRVRAVYLEGQIDRKMFRARNPDYPVLAADPLIVEPIRGSFLVVTKFGALVF